MTGTPPCRAPSTEGLVEKGTRISNTFFYVQEFGKRKEGNRQEGGKRASAYSILYMRSSVSKLVRAEWGVCLVGAGAGAVGALCAAALDHSDRGPNLSKSSCIFTYSTPESRKRAWRKKTQLGGLRARLRRACYPPNSRNLLCTAGANSFCGLALLALLGAQRQFHANTHLCDGSKHPWHAAATPVLTCTLLGIWCTHSIAAAALSPRARGTQTAPCPPARRRQHAS